MRLNVYGSHNTTVMKAVQASHVSSGLIEFPLVDSCVCRGLRPEAWGAGIGYAGCTGRGNLVVAAESLQGTRGVLAMGSPVQRGLRNEGRHRQQRENGGRREGACGVVVVIEQLHVQR